jgi:hypothetical protein
MNTKCPPQPTLSSLARLHEVKLDPYHEAILDSARRSCGGPAPVRHRLLAEAHDLLALSQGSGRVRLSWLDLSCGLRAKIEMEVPVPCLPEPNGSLEVKSRAVLGLIYPPEAIVLPLPGAAFVRILQPKHLWLSNCSSDHNQVLCLGTSLPAGIPVREILILSYFALSVQAVQMDQMDPAGVLNPAAADWWQRNTSRIPLTREPFLRTEVNDAK